MTKRHPALTEFISSGRDVLCIEMDMCPYGSGGCGAMLSPVKPDSVSSDCERGGYFFRVTRQSGDHGHFFNFCRLLFRKRRVTERSLSGTVHSWIQVGKFHSGKILIFCSQSVSTKENVEIFPYGFSGNNPFTGSLVRGSLWRINNVLQI